VGRTLKSPNIIICSARRLGGLSERGEKGLDLGGGTRTSLGSFRQLGIGGKFGDIVYGQVHRKGASVKEDARSALGRLSRRNAQVRPPSRGYLEKGGQRPI